MNVYSVVQDAEFVEYTTINQTYTGFANDSLVIFKTLLMDGNTTYTFTLYNDIGKPAFMFKSGPLVFQDYDIKDDTTYDYASIVKESKETQRLEITR